MPLRWYLIAFAVLAAIQQAYSQGMSPVGVGGNFGTITGTRGSSSSYVGPGDIASGAILFGSCTRSYNAAYATGSNNACLLVDSATGVTTYTMKILSNGKSDVAGASASAACATACRIKTMYDQTGNGNDLTQSTLANMPTMTFGCINTNLPCAAIYPGSLSTTTTITQNQPLTVMDFGKVTTGANYHSLLVVGGNVGMDNGAAANTIRIIAGNNTTETCSDNAFHSEIGVIAGASSQPFCDGTGGSTGSVGGNNANGTAVTYPEFETEAGLWPSNLASSASTMCHNQSLFYGTPSC